MNTYTLFGVYPSTKERWMTFVDAISPRMAEELAQSDNAAAGKDTLWIVGVVEGRVATVDSYATFVDPDQVPEDML